MTQRSILKDFFRVVQGDRRRELAWLTVATSVASVLEVGGIFLVIPLIRMLTAPGWIHDVDILDGAYTALRFTSDQSFIIAFAALALGIFLIKNLFMIAIYRWQRRFADTGTRALTDRLLRAYFYGSYERLSKLNLSAVTRGVRDLTPLINRTVTLGVVNVAAEAIAIIGITAALFFVEKLTAVVVGGVALGISFIFFQMVGSRLKKDIRGNQSGGRGGNRLLADALFAMKEVRLQGREEYFLDRLNASYARDTQRAGARQLVNQSMRPISEIVMLAGTIAVLTSVILTSEPGQSMTSLGILLLAALRLLPSLNRLSRGASGIRTGLPAVAKYLDEIDGMETDQKVATRPALPMPFETSLRFEDVSYTFAGRKLPAIHIDDLTFRPGQFVGVVGPSGSGKSTLINILLGLTAPTTGRILVDGADIRDNIAGWQSKIGYVPQDVVILDDNVRRNVSLGVEDDEIDDDRVRDVIRLADLGGRLEKSPQWLNAPLGEQGSQLSAGQRQRIGIARALYDDPDIIVFDEATRDLDNRSQQAVLRNLRGLTGQKTIIVATHDLAVVRACDIVVFIRGGKVADSGTFDELAARNSAFRNLVRLGGLGAMPARDISAK